MEELVATFTGTRKGLLGFARAVAASKKEEAEEEDDIVEVRRPKKRRKVEAEVVASERRSTRSQSRRMASDAASQQSAPATQEEVIEDSEDEGSLYDDSEPKQSPHFANRTTTTTSAQPHDGLVACPCCHRRMKESLINAHLDGCIAGDSTTPIDDTSPPLPNPQLLPPGTIAYSQRKHTTTKAPPARLPYINYSLFTDSKLRLKLRELGIPNHGSKDLMRRRHTEWVNLWNANCDSSQPVTKANLLRELKVWEDTLGRQVERPTGNTGVMAKEFDRERHVRAQKGSFDDLIRLARERVKRGRNAGDGDEEPSTADGEVTPSALEEVPREFSPNHATESIHQHPGPQPDSVPEGPPTTNLLQDLDVQILDKSIPITSPPLLSQPHAPEAAIHAIPSHSHDQDSSSKRFFV